MNCWNTEGQTIPCGDAGCVGSDCESEFSTDNNNVYGDFITNWESGNPEILDSDFVGLHDMNQEEFLQWGEDLGWAEIYNSMTGYYMSPEWDDMEEAFEMMPNYDASDEMYIMGALAESVGDSNASFNSWLYDATNLNYDKSQRQANIMEKQNKLATNQSNVASDNASVKAKSQLLQLNDKRLKTNKNKTGPGVSLEDQALTSQLSTLMDTYLNSSSLEGDSLNLQIQSNIESHNLSTESSIAKLNQLAAAKDFNRQKALQKQKSADIDTVRGYREQYEVDIWDLLNSFAQGERFVPNTLE